MGESCCCLELFLQLSNLKHFIVTDKEAVGPFQTAEVISYLKENPNILQSVQWISPAGNAPLLVMEWFTDFAGEGELEAILARQAPAPSAHPSLWSGEKKETSVSGNSGETSKPLDSGRDNTPGRNRLFQRAWRELLALFGVGLIGLAILVAGLKSLRPGKPLLRTENTLQAKLLSATPDALRTYQLLLESKIIRDPKKHAEILLKIQKDRALYPEGHLPSPEVTASLALVSLSHSDLDKIPEWKEILVLLSSEARQRGPAMVAYELSRVMQVRREIFVTQGKKKEDKTAAAVDEVAIVLDRLIRVVPTTQPAERMLHGLLLARTVALSLITTLEYPQLASKNALLKTNLERLPELLSSLTSTDREMIGILLNLARQSQSEPKKTLSWKPWLDKVAEYNLKSSFICQINDSGAAAETLLFLIQRATAHKQRLPEISGEFEKCFAGLRVFPQLSATPGLDDLAARLEFVNLGSIDERLLRDFRISHPTMSPALARLSGKQNAAGGWLLALQFNNILDARLRGSRTASGSATLCSKSMADTLLCLRARWSEMQGDWRELLPLLSELQEQAKPAEISLIVERFVLDAARNIVLRNEKNATKEIGELFDNLKTYGVSDNPSLRFVLDYAKSRDGES